MIEIYKIITEKDDKTASDFIKLWTNLMQRSSERGHGFKFFPQRAKLDVRKHSFTVRMSQIWNSLPDHVVNAKTLNTFKNILDKWWDEQEIKYDNYKSEITITGSHRSVIEEASDKEDPVGTCIGNMYILHFKHIS
jgi:hypothetical protein